MTPEDVKNIVRLEMRALAAALHNSHTGNHDADQAIKQVARAVYAKFPLTVREECERIQDGYPYLRNTHRYQLDDVGERIKMKREMGEEDGPYRARLQARVEGVLNG